ncbi:hypothetical protein [Oscillibacter sp.]|uniref:hypothetical protein n=1 Tax=Oscillibacter sp. TaxID=1945593 RepID=UPI00258D2ED8|nr:hypothetical protein [Oscillibacter sp.]
MTDQPKTKQVKDLLRRYTAMLRNIDNQYARLDRLAVKMEAPPGPDLTGMPRGQGTPTDRTGMMVIPFQRMSKARTDLQKFTAISVPQMITSDRTSEKIMARLQEETAKRFQHNLDRALGR